MTTSRLTLLSLLSLSLALGCSTARREPEWERPLPPGTQALRKLPEAWEKPDISHQWSARSQILPALQNSRDWMERPSSKTHFPMAGIGHELARDSLARFEVLLQTSSGPQAFAAAVEREFDFYQGVGWDGRGGGTLFTAYCTPILDGKASPDKTYRFPLYALPEDLAKGANGEILGRRRPDGSLMPYATRRVLETRHLLDNKGLELVWLKDPLDAFLAHVNGSAFIRLRDGSMLRLGYAGKNGAEYRSLRAELEARGELREGERGLPGLRKWAARTPEDEVVARLHHNPSYVFFTPIEGTPRGSLNVPVTAERTLATDKSIFPRGGLVYVDAGGGSRGRERFAKLMLDQDTGGAIRTAGRADLYLGSGQSAERRAGETVLEGQMYYLFLKRDPPR